jgi:HAD superfamily hydrolase (TIGR01509 family)
MVSALIFDCDGVLVDTERDAHRVGFNRAFEHFGIDAEWSVERYGELLNIAGGKERMTAYFNDDGWPEDKVAEYGGQQELIAALHKYKTAEVSQIVRELPVRPGVLRIVDEAIANEVRLGVCTTSNAKFIDAVLDLFGAERKAAFEFVHAGDVVSKKKPDPEIYELATKSLGLDPKDCLVIEDSRNGLLASTGAGYPTLITTSTYTVDENFSEAARVVPELGDAPNPQVTLADLSALTA